MEITREAVDWFFSRSKISIPFKDIEKAKRICEMRLNGELYRNIGLKVGLSTTATRNYVERVARAYYGPKRRILTNYDKVRTMTIDEMAEFFAASLRVPKQDVKQILKDEVER